LLLTATAPAGSASKLAPIAQLADAPVVVTIVVRVVLGAAPIS
jgi:hypothetical protein